MFGDYKTIEEFKEASGYTIDGVWYPRVTKIVTIKSKPALYYYYGEAKSYKAAQEATEQSAKEGTMIHEAVEGLMLGKQPEIPEAIAPAVASFLEFFDRNSIHVTPELVERRIVNYDHRYAGTVDAIAMIGGKLGVLDIKTSQAIYRDYCLQTSAYMDALKGEFERLETRWILKIDQVQYCTLCGARRRLKGGREKIKIDWRDRRQKTCSHEWGPLAGDIELQEFPYWQNDFQAFLGAKRLWEWENEDWLKRAGYLA
ncbi:MAG TPA: hypothetical protein VMT99_04110 [Candidatus Paceibacterota bacterium]|nr:hypothetical protein [Candidatus Paceibacterota bacterium]